LLSFRRAVTGTVYSKVYDEIVVPKGGSEESIASSLDRCGYQYAIPVGHIAYKKANQSAC